MPTSTLTPKCKAKCQMASYPFINSSRASSSSKSHQNKVLHAVTILKIEIMLHATYTKAPTKTYAPHFVLQSANAFLPSLLQCITYFPTVCTRYRGLSALKTQQQFSYRKVLSYFITFKRVFSKQLRCQKYIQSRGYTAWDWSIKSWLVSIDLWCDCWTI